MQFVLHFQTSGDVDKILSIIYGFIPTNTFTHIGGGVLETILPATANFSPAQWAVVKAVAHTLDFVLPTTLSS